MKSTLRVGLTGGIGSGKTTICHFFAKLGTAIIDADTIAHELTETGKVGYETIVDEFGKIVLDSQSKLDRKHLRDIVFNDDKKRKMLNSILHPLIYAEIDRQSSLYKNSYCIISIPLLLETNGQKHVDRILVIKTDIEQRVQRAAERDKVEPATIKKIIDAQISDEKRILAADDIIENSADLLSLEKQVNQLHLKYTKLTTQKN